MNGAITIGEWVIGAIGAVLFYHWGKYVFIMHLGLIFEQQPETFNKFVETGFRVLGHALLLGTVAAVIVLVPKTAESKVAERLAEKYGKV